jgi:acetyl esterase/lipase
MKLTDNDFLWISPNLIRSLKHPCLLLSIFMAEPGLRASAESNLTQSFPTTAFSTARSTIASQARRPFPPRSMIARPPVRYLRAHAAELYINLDRIGVWGGSAGGHLAALLGTSYGVPELEGESDMPGVSSRVQAVLTQSAGTDLLDPSWSLLFEPDSPVARLLGGPAHEHATLARLASPVSHVRADAPPFLLVHGACDDTVPAQQSVALHEALRKVGANTTLEIVEEGDHDLSGYWETFRQRLLSFFQQHLAD